MSINATGGPYVAFGKITGWETGPNLGTFGDALMDMRPPFNYNPGQAFGSPTMAWNLNSHITTLNAIPMTLSNTIIAAANHTVGGTAMTLASANADGIAVGVSIARSDTNVLVTGCLKLDPLVASVVASIPLGSTIMTVTTVNAAGGHCYNQLCCGMVLKDATNAGYLPTGTKIIGWSPNNGGTGSGLLGTYQLSAAATTAISGDTITGLYTVGSQYNQATGGLFSTVAPGAVAFGAAGTVQLYNPCDMISRAVSITSTTSQVVQTFTVRGFDVYGFPVTEVITLSGTTATTTNGKKAFKYILSVTPSVTDGTGSYSVGTQDVIGFPIRSDAYQVAAEYDISLTFNNAAIASATGYLAAVLTSPATSSTGDVRGTYALQTASNGTLRLFATQTPLAPSLGSPTGIFGVTPYADF